VAPSHKRVYGKRGTASSRAVLSDHFLDENEIELEIGNGTDNEIDNQILKTITEQASLPAPPAPPLDSYLSQDVAKIVTPAQKPLKTQDGLVSTPSALLALFMSIFR
jgi:hypothetical protein